jgi:Trypsin-like peptidase domain
MNYKTSTTKRLGASGLISLILIASSFGRSQEQSPQCKELTDKPVTVTGERVTVTGKRNSIAEDFPADSKTMSIPADSNARYLRVRFELDSPAGCDWYLTVRDSMYRVIQTFTPRNIRNPQNQWTVRIPGSVARFQLERCGENSPAIKFKEYIWMPEEEKKNSYYTVQDLNRKRIYPLYKSLESVVPTSVRPWGDYVGFMMSSWGSVNWACSGVLVAPDLFLTNWHCGAPPTFTSDDGYWSPQIVEDTIIDFSWDDDDLSREYIAAECVAADKALDFAILKVRAIDSAEEARPAVLSSRPVKSGDPIRIIHHPAAMRKQTSDCQVVDAPYKEQPTDFTHRCDTEAGSSGAPVFDSQGNVVGLHHHGFEVIVKNNNCRYADNLNKAVRMDKILEFLECERQDVYKKLKIIK